MATLQTRSEFFKAAPALRVVHLHIPEMDATINVRELTGAQRDHFEKDLITVNGKNTKITMDNIRARLIVASVVDDEGKLMFAESDVDQIGAMGAGIVSHIYDVASGLSGLSEEDVEELLKNSGSVQSDASGSN